jgi:hypothetical protein
MKFEALAAFQRRLRDIKRIQSKSLASYFVEASSTGQGVGFRHLWDEVLPSDQTKKAYSGASTATCIVSLTSTGDWWYETEELAEGKRWSSHTSAIVSEFCEKPPKEWDSAGLGKGNPFTVAFTLEALKELVVDRPELSSELKQSAFVRIREAETLLLDTLRKERGNPRSEEQFAEPGAAHINFYPPTSFLTQLVIRSLGSETFRADNLLREQVEGWCRRQIEHELALHGAPASARDPLALAYSVTAFVSVVDPGKLSPADVGLVGRAVEYFFGAQLQDGSWPRSKPLHHYPHFGNAYCYEYETLAQMLRQSLLEDILLTKIDCLRKSALALDRTANKIRVDAKAWSSGHHPHVPGAESWSTASVFQFVHQLDRLLAEAIRRSTFSHVGSVYTKPNEQRSPSDKFDPKDFLDSRFQLEAKDASLRETVQDYLLQPILRDVLHIKRGQRLPKKTNISAILFGPPGTSKTKLAAHIAEHLGWPRLDIDPSHLFKSGLEQIQSESNRLFNMLAALERTVVFFDEFDEMTRERTSERADLISRFLTTAMLPKLSRIAEQRRIVFLLATNHIEDFDFAISRPGRFDLLLPVMAPSLQEKFAAPRWKGFSAKVTPFLDDVVPDYDRSASALTWRRILESLTYDEFAALFDATKNVDSSAELQNLIRSAWGMATLAKPAEKVEDDSHSLLDLYDGQSRKFARIRKPLTS